MMLTEEYLREISGLVGIDPDAALETIRRLDAEYPDDTNLRSNRGAFLIDIGSALGDVHLVQEGVESLEEFIDTYPDLAHPHQLYNIANGYTAIHSIERGQSGFEFDPVTSPLTQGKHWYRRALAAYQEIDADQRARLHVNYGNCLAGLGRTVDAITEYHNALRIDPDHPMALGNLGIEIVRFGRIVGNRVFLLDARDALHQAISSDRLDALGAHNARQHFLSWYEAVQKHVEGVSSVDPRSISGKPRHYATKRHEEYMRFCIRHELFLTLGLFDHHFESIAADSIGFSITTSIDDDTTFVRLSRIVNEIKEQFATARLLLFEAINPPHRVRPYDDLTHYTDNLDYAIYGLDVGKLKLAYRSALDILDKIALFMNDYLRLGLKPRGVTFASLWIEAKQGVLRSPVRQANSYHLFALYDVARDVSSGGEFEYLSVARNYLTHRYLTVHMDHMYIADESDDPEYHIEHRDLIIDSIEVMALVRNSVIYLVAFIDEFEQKKHLESGGLSVPMYMPRFRSFDP